MLKKSSILCSCCGGISLLSPPASISPPSATSRSPGSFHRRRFAHVNSTPVGPHGDLTWPTSPTFSPYELLKQERLAPYSKRHYYELVKIYHPDRPCNGHPMCRDLPDSVRKDRYRILVAAHEILSDPVKRAAYDNFGDGWHHRQELFGPHTKQNTRRSAGYKYSTKRPGDDIFRNATWEDWERFYERRDGRPKQAQTVSHSTFASFLLLLALFGGIGQAVTIGKFSSFVQERVQSVNEKCGKILEGRRQSTLNQMNSRDARVQSFLMKRDPSGYGLKEEEQETYRRICSPHRTTDVTRDIDSMKEDTK